MKFTFDLNNRRTLLIFSVLFILVVGVVVSALTLGPQSSTVRVSGHFTEDKDGNKGVQTNHGANYIILKENGKINWVCPNDPLRPCYAGNNVGSASITNNIFKNSYPLIIINFGSTGTKKGKAQVSENIGGVGVNGDKLEDDIIMQDSAGDPVIVSQMAWTFTNTNPLSKESKITFTGYSGNSLVNFFTIDSSNGAVFNFPVATIGAVPGADFSAFDGLNNGFTAGTSVSHSDYSGNGVLVTTTSTDADGAGNADYKISVTGAPFDPALQIDSIGTIINTPLILTSTPPASPTDHNLCMDIATNTVTISAGSGSC